MIPALVALVLLPVWRISFCLHSGTEWVLCVMILDTTVRWNTARVPVMDFDIIHCFRVVTILHNSH